MSGPATEIPPFKSAHARYAHHTARILGYGFRSLDAADGYLFEVSDGARRAFFSAGSGSPYAFNRAHANALGRDKAFAQSVLSDVGLATIPSQLFFTSPRRAELRAPGREPADARAYARSAPYPMFCKPINGAQGAFAEIIRDVGQFDRYLDRLAPSHYAFVAQPVIEAPEYRVLVLEGRALFSYRKNPPSVLGDGASSLVQLVLSAIAEKRPGEPAPVLAETLSGRDGDGRSYYVDEIPPDGSRVVLDGAANRALGGSADPPRTDVPAALAQFALACASALRLELAAVDLFDRGEGGLCVIEVNCNPAIKTLDDHGRWDLIETIWRANFAAALK